MRGSPIRTNVLSARILPNADPALLRQLQVPPGHTSLGLFTTDCDDVSYAALDEATKRARVQVAYARSMYAGAANASTALAGEFIGILSAETEADVRSGLEAAIRYAQTDACFYSANDQDTVVYFAHCISRTGSYLSREAGVAEGPAMADLIAPPLEAVVGLDAAVKAADVSIGRFYGPPSETNFAGGLLTGSQSACQAACEAFAAAVCGIAGSPAVY